MTQSKKNYQRELDRILVGLDRQGRPDPHTGQASLHGTNGLDMPNASDGRVPTLLLHSCCAPCSSYVLEYLSHFFSITVFYYNPNIYPEEARGGTETPGLGNAPASSRPLSGRIF